MKQLLVTGSSGFVGSTLVRYLEAHPELGHRAVGTEQTCDLRDPIAVRELVEQSRPDHVVHLAAQSFVPASFADPRATFEVNLEGTLNLLEALAHARFAGRLVYVSSGDVYGAVDEAFLPVEETLPPKPRNPYAVSKVAAEALCHQWSCTEAVDVVIARPFNHIGPGQHERFAVSGFAKQVASITLSQQTPVVRAGDVDVTRDFTDVEDVIRAYLLLIERGQRGETYNVASGREVSLRDVIESLCSLARVDAEIRVDPSRLRTGEQRRMRASSRRIEAATGWSPLVPLEQSLERILEYWKKELGG